jgi:hypothetical protein
MNSLEIPTAVAHGAKRRESLPQELLVTRQNDSSISFNSATNEKDETPPNLMFMYPISA